MKRFVGLVSTLALLGLSACVAEDRYYRGPYRNDARIGSAVDAELDRHGLRDVDVSMAGGTVYLGGVVRDRQERKVAGQIASRTRGVARVVNDIQVVRYERAGDGPDEWDPHREGHRHHPRPQGDRY